MVNSKHLELIRSGATIWNQWYKDNEVTPDLTNAEFSEHELQGINLRNADLRGARFWNVVIEDSDLTSANLSGTSFRDCTLIRVVLAKALMQGVCFDSCTINSSDFTEGDLQQSEFSKGFVIGCSFDKSNLTLSTARRTDFRNSSFYRANLDSADFTWAEHLNPQKLLNALIEKASLPAYIREYIRDFRPLDDILKDQTLEPIRKLRQLITCARCLERALPDDAEAFYKAAFEMQMQSLEFFKSSAHSCNAMRDYLLFLRSQSKELRLKVPLWYASECLGARFCPIVDSTVDLVLTRNLMGWHFEWQ